MNKDSDKNENRRDGDNSRSFGRRDDGRTSKPAGSRSNDADRPRFNRASGSDDSSSRPRSNSPRPSFGRSADKPRFGRTNDERPRFSRDGGSAPRSNDRNRDERPAGPRGRSDADRNRFERPSGPTRPTYGRDRNDGPRNDGPRNDGPRNDGPRDGATPRFRSADSDQRRARPDNDRSKPRFERRDDARTDGPRSNGPARPYDRTERNDRPSGDARPRFERGGSDRNRTGGTGRPEERFKRVGGFSREADERNRDSWTPKDKDRDETKEGGSRNTRFTPEQRKDSGDRRTGFFVKAPNYELEQQRIPGFKRNGRAADAGARPRTTSDRQAPKGRPDLRKSQNEPEQKPSPRTPTGEPGTTRLNRYIANSGVCSRREADELIARGDISVNGKVVTEMGFRVKEGDTVKYGTKSLTPERFVYVLLNKPKDYLTTTEDPEERKTVMELVADAGNFRMYPVGRLDRKTTGLLLITNDGELADKLTHPSNNVRKIYQVELDKPITEEHFDAIKKGIDLEDGHIKPDALSIVTPDGYVVGIEIHSGRNRIVRRIFESLGYDVTKLDRTTYAGLTKKELPRGKWRFLDPKEVVKLKYLS